jgi:hypothetical protein
MSSTSESVTDDAATDDNKENTMTMSTTKTAGAGAGAGAGGAGAGAGGGAGAGAGAAVNDDNKKKDPKHRIEWSPENEAILVEWCDIGSVYKWLHTRAQQMYSKMHAWFTIPAIVLSTISGTASFAQTSLPIAYQSYSPLAIGGLNIFIGIFSTVAQYMKISELNESFRVAAIAWDKYSRNIRIELAKAPLERTDAYTFLKYSREEFDRLMETSPTIPPKVVTEFTSRFSGINTMGFNDTVKMARFEKLKKPDICDIIISAEEYRHPWYKEIEHKRRLEAEAEAEAIKASASAMAAINGLASRTEDLEEDSSEMELRIQRDLIKRQEQLRVQEEEMREKMRLMAEKEQEAERQRQAAVEHERDAVIRREQEEQRRKRAAQEQRIRDFIQQFADMSGRSPLAEEIEDHFGDSIDRDTLEPFLSDV